MCGRRLVVQPVWALMEVTEHLDTLAVNSDQLSQFSVVSSIAWQFCQLLAVRHMSSVYCRVLI